MSTPSGAFRTLGHELRRASRRTRHSFRWAILGALLSVGAPGGLWIVLAMFAPRSSLVASVAYWYIGAATLIAFVAFGFFAGLLMDRLRAISVRDSLTGLHSRGHFMTEAAYRLRGCRLKGLPVALMMIDLDHFKAINDACGHMIGDNALRAVAHTIQRNLRPADLIARFGGEEFVVFGPDLESSTASEIAERIRDAVAGLDAHRLGCEQQLTVSVGVVIAPDASGAELDGLVLEADDAMYAAKRAGRDRVATRTIDFPATGHASHSAAIRQPD